MTQGGAAMSALLEAFLKEHCLKRDVSRLAHMAAANDWIHFLAEASAGSYSLQEVRTPPPTKMTRW